ncbi:MAG TPA: hypothetical protein VFV76_08445 [Actinomycetes bacterium]|nr:hypothetical protein [Actinomycetes bacterium]
MTVSLTPTRLRGARTAAAALGLALLLGACSAATAEQGGDSAGTPAESARSTADGPGPSDTPDPALSGQPVPTLPPGDPGTDGSGEAATDDAPPEGDDGHAGEHGPDEAVGARTVPAAALVDAATVAALAGGSWSTEPDTGSAAGCPPVTPAGAAASRTLLLRSADGTLLQVVSAHRTVRAARQAVDSVAGLLAGCGFTSAGDPRLGEASAALARDDSGAPEKAVVIAAEGATVVLVGRGSAASAAAWDSLADLALGTSCAAGVHGCH